MRVGRNLLLMLSRPKLLIRSTEYILTVTQMSYLMYDPMLWPKIVVLDASCGIKNIQN